MGRNLLCFGDNLKILRSDIFPNESVDLIYLDPPFNSNQSYNVLFADESGSPSASQIEAFDDTWHWNNDSQTAFEEVVEAGGPPSLAMQAFRKLLGENDMMAYLAMMAPRLVEMHRVLRPTGSLYLHCDPTACHYLKVLLDAIFGPVVFRNEIIWQRTNAHSDSKCWSRVADTLLYYSKADNPTWNAPREELAASYVKAKYRHQDNDGRLYQLGDMTSPSPRPNMMYEWKGFPYPPKGWRYSKRTMERLDSEGRIWYPRSKDGDLDTSRRPRLKRYLDERKGKPMNAVWTDIRPLNSQAQERLGFPTQKPEALLERIIEASSNEGDIVLDPFCGCGTAIAAAQSLNRSWVGIDITHLATTLIKQRLKDSFKTEVEYDVYGEPTSVAGAKALAHESRYQFQYWALSLIGARVEGPKKGPDKGIDGRIPFFDNGHKSARQVIVSVKSGGVNVSHVRDLRGVISRERAQIGVLVTLRKPTKAMLREAASAEQYKSSWGKHPKIQIFTIEELLSGKLVDYPVAAKQDYKRAPRRYRVVEQPSLFEPRPKRREEPEEPKVPVSKVEKKPAKSIPGESERERKRKAG